MAIPEPELIVVAQRQRPAATRHHLLSVFEAIAQLLGLAVGQGGEQVGGEGEVEGGMQFVSRQVGRRFVHRLDRLRDHQHVAVTGLHPGPQPPQEGVGLRQPFTAGALLLEQERHRIEAESIDPFCQPKVDHVQHRLLHGGVVVIQVGLVVQKAMQVVLAGHLIPLPVRLLEVAEQHWRLGIAVVVVAPDVEIAFGAALSRPAGPLEPRMQDARVVEHQVENHPDPMGMGLLQQHHQVIQIAQVGVNGGEIGDVVAAVLER